MSISKTEFLILQVIFSVAMVILVTRATQKRGEFLEDQARKRNGTVRKGPFGLIRDFCFPVEGLEVVVTSHPGSRNSPPKTGFKCLITSSMEITIYRESGLSKVGKMFGAQELQLGIPQLDDSFFIKSADGNFVRNLLTPPIQAKLLELKEIYPTLKVSKGALDFSVTKYYNKHPEFDNFIETGILILKRLRELR